MTTIRWRRSVITLDCHTGARDVAASVARGLAVHKTVIRDGERMIEHEGDYWTVSHVASGKSIRPTHLGISVAGAPSPTRGRCWPWGWTRVDVMDLREATGRVRGEVGL